jgi:5-dehydro-2-deoxygluconokinase
VNLQNRSRLKKGKIKDMVANSLPQVDLITMGRSSIDLYANEVGAFVDIKSFAAYVGGSPTNIAVGARRLGLQVALLTAVGNDPVADFLLHFLEQEQVNTRYIPRKPSGRTSAVVLGIEETGKFPLVFYRSNAADILLNIDDVLAAPIASARAFVFVGTNLAQDPIRSATLFAVEQARMAGIPIFCDLDFRPDQWHDPRAYGAAIRSILPSVDIVFGTEDELNAALLIETQQMHLTHSQVSDTKVSGDVHEAIAKLLSLGPTALMQKLGAEGVRVHVKQKAGQVERIEVPGYPVQVYNILGAGDAFAAGFLYGYLNGWGWYKSGRLANACGAIVVTKHGCANFTPTMAEVESFVSTRGGF